jgi:hypothetical protein
MVVGERWLFDRRGKRVLLLALLGSQINVSKYVLAMLAWVAFGNGHTLSAAPSRKATFPQVGESIETLQASEKLSTNTVSKSTPTGSHLTEDVDFVAYLTKLSI